MRSLNLHLHILSLTLLNLFDCHLLLFMFRSVSLCRLPLQFTDSSLVFSCWSQLHNQIQVCILCRELNFKQRWQPWSDDRSTTLVGCCWILCSHSWSQSINPVFAGKMQHSWSAWITKADRSRQRTRDEVVGKVKHGMTLVRLGIASYVKQGISAKTRTYFSSSFFVNIPLLPEEMACNTYVIWIPQA